MRCRPWGLQGHLGKVLRRLPCILSVSHLLSPCKPYTGIGTSHSPDPLKFADPYVTGVGGTTSFDPEVGSEISGGDISAPIERPFYKDERCPFPPET